MNLRNRGRVSPNTLSATTVCRDISPNAVAQDDGCERPMADTSTTATTDQCAVLIVAPSPDDVLLRLGQSLSETGAAVHFTTDVYMAMARLANGEQFEHVVVEAAGLDDYERAFLKIAPQYYETSAFYVPARAVLDDHALAEGRYEVLSPGGIVDAVLGIREAETAESAADTEAEWTEPRTIGEPELPDAKEFHDASHPPEAPPKLSTDGGVDDDQLGPSLHDAVRQRMGGEASPPAPRRRPPGSTEPPDAPPAAETDARVSREEMDALLGHDDDTLDEMTDATRKDGKDDA